MKRLKPTLTVIIALFLILGVTAAVAQDDEKKPDPVHAPDVLPGVEPEMLDPGYWITLHDDADEVVMTPEQIEAFNRRVRTQPVVFEERFGKTDPLFRNYLSKLSIGLYMHPVLPLELPATLPGDSLRTWLGSNIEYLYSRDFYDSRNATWNERMKRELVDNINLDAVPNTIERRYGLICRRADVRLFPTSAAGFSETKWEMDFFQTTGEYIITPVAILHQSTYGDFYYVQTPVARGWISADNIALADRNAIRKLVEADFLMAAGDKVPVYADPEFTRFVQFYRMSSTLPFKKKTDDAWIVTLPYRSADGSMKTMDAYIRPDADVHEGYLPFTKRNSISQIFKLLHTPYGWADQFDKRDCSGAQRVVLRCFGIITGRWPNFVLLAPEHRTYIDSEWSTEKKTEVISQIEGGITWCGTGGHLVFYLGKARNGKLYFMHMGGWGYDEGDQHYFVNRVAINESSHSWYNIDSPRVFSTFRP